MPFKINQKKQKLMTNEEKIWALVWEGVQLGILHKYICKKKLTREKLLLLEGVA